MSLRLLIQQAWTENQLIEQDVLLDGKCYAVSVVAVSEDCCVNIYGRDITEHCSVSEAVRHMREKS